MRRAALAGVLVTLPYLLMLWWFQTADVYHRRFFEPGSIVVLYNAVRVLFAAYLAWMMMTTGWWLRRRFSAALPLGQEMVICGLIGLGVWHVGLYAVGLLGGYRYGFCVVLTVVPLLCSGTLACAWWSKIKLALSDWKVQATGREKLAAALTVLVMILFLLAKALYPGGGHDYYTHYFHYDQAVVASGSTWPNEVWYHFYYNKGMGLFFLATLLTDPLSVGLVGALFQLLAAVMLFQLVRQLLPNTLWPWLAAGLFLALQIYIRGWEYGPWGELQKPHALTAALLMGMVYLLGSCREQQDKRLWTMALLATSITCVVITFTTLPIVLGLLFCFAVYWRKERVLWGIMLVVLAVAGIDLGINYAFTGVWIDQALSAQWPWMKLRKLDDWGVLTEMLVARVERGKMVDGALPLTLSTLKQQIGTTLRLDILGWWVLPMLVLLLWRRKRLKVNDAALVALLLVGMAVGLSLTAGRGQPLSFYRFSSFAFAPMLYLAAWMTSSVAERWRRDWVPLAIAVACLLPMSIKHQRDALFPFEWHATVARYLGDTLRYAAGSYSLYDGYREQTGRGVATAISPGVEPVWRMLPPGTRVWSLHPFTYCMLPGCRMESFQSFRLSKQSSSFFAWPAERIEQTLRAEGLDYFFIDMDIEIKDYLPHTSLFAPEHIATYLGIAWTDGTRYLLTWKTRETQALDAAWLKRYRGVLTISSVVQEFPLETVRQELTPYVKP